LLSQTAATRPARYYVMRVLGADSECNALHVSVVGYPYPCLIAAWLAAGLHRLDHPTQVFIAGEMAVPLADIPDFPKLPRYDDMA
jgi:hypothetical protein